MQARITWWRSAVKKKLLTFVRFLRYYERMKKQLARKQYRYLTTTVDEGVKRRFREKARRVGETPATRLRRLIIQDVWNHTREERRHPQVA